VIFYWKVREDLPASSKEKILALSSAVIIIIVSVMSLGQFIYTKVHPDDASL
jgi:hypothetical protein